MRHQPSNDKRKFSLPQPQHHLGAATPRQSQRRSSPDKVTWRWWMTLPDAFVGVPPEGHHFVDLQGPSSVGAATSCPQGPVFYLGQEVFGKGAAHVVVIAILKIRKQKTC